MSSDTNVTVKHGSAVNVIRHHNRVAILLDFREADEAIMIYEQIARRVADNGNLLFTGLGHATCEEVE